MQARRTLPLGHKGAKKFLKRYGGQLVCARIRYDERRHKCVVAIEIIESGWSPTENPEIVDLSGEFQGTESHRHVRPAGGRWNSAKRVWEIDYDQAAALGLKKRIVKLAVSDI